MRNILSYEEFLTETSTKIINDPIFGEMIYKHSWRKIENVKFQDIIYTVAIIAKAYNGENIIDSQRDMYKYAINNINKIWNKSIPKIFEYCNDSKSINFNIAKKYVKENITPTAILFQRDKSFGILCDYKEDYEHGIVIVINNKNITICSQDEFL